MDGNITLFNEEGVPVHFTFLDLIEYKDKEYVVLLPEDAGNPPEVIILQVEETEKEAEESYIGVEDESLLEEIFSEFQRRNKGRFNFVD